MIEHFKKCAACLGTFGQRTLAVLLALVIGMAVAPNEAFAQSKTVSGVVSDQVGPVPGVGVFLKGNSTVGTSTDADGHYTLSGLPSDAVLVFNALGFAEVEEVVGNRTTINVTLSEDALMLSETVVVGYGTQRKGDITSAVASVKSEDFLTGNIGDAAQLIKGKVAGLNIAKGTGNPSESSTIMLRGVTSLMGGFTPLVLVDGIEGSLETVAPENIAEISVLKDASAAAIYGTRGASGVIIITTKAGKRGERYNVSYSGYGAISDFAKTADFMDAAYMRSLGDDMPKYTAFADLGEDTDWLGLVSQTGWVQNHNVSLEGGTQSMTYSANVSYRQNEGVIKGSFANDLRAQMDISQYLFDDILKLNFNMLKSISESDNQSSYYIYHQAVTHNPTSPVYTADGDYYEQTSPLYYYNPLPYITGNEHFGQNRNESTRLTGNITLEPIEGWQTNLMLSSRTNNGVGESYNTEKYQSNRWGGINGSASKSQSDFEEHMLELTSKYENSFGDHRISALVGYSWLNSVSSGFSASNSEFSTNAYLYNNLANGTYLKDGKAGVGSWKNSSRLIGFFGRISYGYADRYNVLVSLRHEGSSKFGADHKWGNFPGVSAGWTISNEEWMEGTRSWLDNLKLRASFGITGVIPGSSYMSLLRYDYDTSYGNFVDASGKWSPSLTPISNANPDLRWEKSTEYNIGLDMGFFGNRLYANIDLYNKVTSDMLWEYSVPVPPNLYGYTTANVGSMSNQGIEVLIGGTPVQTKNFEWNSTLTLAHNRNKLLSMSNDLYETEDYLDGGWTEEPTSMVTQRTYIGDAIGTFYMLKSVGVVPDGPKKGLWLIEDPETGEAVSFDSGMRNYDSRFRQNCGSALPKLTMGWSNTLRFYGVDVTMSFSGQFGYKIFNCQRMFYENLNIGLNRYKSATQPVYGTTLAKSQQPVAVSYYLEDGDYLKLDNFTVGYTFNTKNVKYLDKARVYLSGENLLCITKYQGLDPELNYSGYSSFGMDYREKYPTLRTFSVGVNITFGNK